MKCPSCYADYSSEEPRCPYCGAENPRYQKKVEQEKKWEDQYQKKKSEVLASSRLLIVKRALNGLILGAVAVFVICLVLSVAWELRSDSRQEEQQGAYLEQLEAWYQEGRYALCYGFLLDHILYGPEYEKYQEAGQLEQDLQSYRQDLQLLRDDLQREAQADAEQKAYRSEAVNSSIVAMLRAGSSLLNGYQQLESEDPVFLAFAREAEQEVRTGLQMYLGLTPEEIEQLQEAEYQEDYQAFVPEIREEVEQNGAE